MKARYQEGDESQRARSAGRIVLLRDIGKLIFITLRDRTGTIQVGLSKGMLTDQWPLAKLLDIGDIIGAAGKLGKTKTGEITIWVEEGGLTFLSKCLFQPPEKFHGLADVDQRYRQRYVDLWANPEVLDRFQKRSEIVATIRRLLISKGFLEVETPMMQTIAGGAAAKPFITHHNALDLELYLRIAPELFLKRLLVGGMERVFEINRNFRNEGLDRHHNPEFTMMELYQAYADYRVMMDITEEIVSACIEALGLGTKVPFGDVEIDFTRPWRRAKYADLLKEHSGCDIDDIAAIRAKARALQIEDAGMDDAVVVNEVFEATVEDKLVVADVRDRLPGRPVPADQAQPDRSEVCRAVRAVRRGHGAGQRLHRAERPRRAVRELPAPASRPGRIADEDGHGLRYGAEVRHAARRRAGHRHRPARHGPDRRDDDPRRDPVSAPEARGAREQIALCGKYCCIVEVWVLHVFARKNVGLSSGSLKAGRPWGWRA